MISTVIAVVVDDRLSFAPMLARRVEREGASVRCAAHSAALVERGGVLEGLGPRDLVLLDALDIGAQQEDPRASRLQSLDVLERIARQRGRAPRVVVYSTAMADPAVNIPLRSRTARVEAYYDVVSLLDSLPSVMAGSYPGQVPAPSEADFVALDPGLTSAADVGAAHQHMRGRPIVWEQVWNPAAPFDRAAQRWISRNVLPLLAVPSSAGYALAVNVVRRVAGLPSGSR